MPNPPTANMGLVLPAETGDTGAWGSLLNAALGTGVDQHTHEPGKGVKVPLATGATVNADVAWNSGGSFYAITGLKALDFEPSAAAGMAGYAGALFVNVADSELYWRTTGGTNVKLTSGTSINVALVGAIGGDYASVGALLDFTDATDTYAARQQVGAAVRQYGHFAVGDLDLYEFKAHPTAGVPANRVRHKSPASLAASYDLTWLTALPGATTPLQVTSAGQIVASITHVTQTVQLAIRPPETPAFISTASNQVVVLSNPNNGFTAQIALQNGERITAIRARIRDNATGPTTLAVRLMSVVAGSLATVIATGSASSGAGTTQTISVTGLTTTVATNTVYFASINAAAGSASCDVYAVEVDYDR